MRDDMKVYLPHHRDWRCRKATKRDSISLAFLLVLVLLGMGLAGREDMLAKEKKMPEWRRVVVSYERPAAFRKASPTQEQMDQLEHLQRVSQVVR
jgi:hypothetical protein